MTRVVVVACIWMACGAAAHAAPSPAKPVVVRASGSDTLSAYDEVAKLLASAAKAGATGAVRLRLFGEAEKRVVDALANVKKLKGNGGWRNGLMYRTASGETLTEDELLHRLVAMGTRAKTAHDELAAKQPATAKQPTAKQPTAKQPTAKGPTSKRERPACAEGLTRCSDDETKCVNLMKNPDHCGDCTTSCTFVQMSASADSAACVQGTCIPRCAAHAKLCNGVCTDIWTTSNCGSCGHECTPGKFCDDGKCSP